MAYIGNTPAENFVSVVKQDITGNGGTSYTLNHSVSSPGELEVFVNNVQQEPTTAYTVSGTTLTFTEAVTSSDDIYVVFRGRTMGTTEHPAGAALTATSGTFSGDLTVDTNTLKVDSANNRVGVGTAAPADELHINSTGANVNLRLTRDTNTGCRVSGSDGATTPAFIVDTIESGTATERMRIDASGRVTTPNQPSFLARGIAGQPGVGGVFVFNGADYNRGNCYSTSNGRFTAPVNGFYMFTCHVMSDGTDGRLMIRLFKNGTHMSQGSSSSNANQYQDSRIAFMMYMAAGDYAEVQYLGYKSSYNNNAYHNHFAGHLLG